MNKFDQARKAIEARPISIQPYAALMLTIIDHAERDAKRVVQLEAEREALVKTACREQRFLCVDAVNAHTFLNFEIATATVQNAPAPSLADVLAKMPEVPEE